MSYEGNCRLGDLFSSRREKGGEGLPILSVTLNSGLVNRDDLDRKQETNLSSDEHLLVKPGDIAYNMMRMWQGASGLADKEGLVSPAYVVLKPKPTVDSAFASYLFKTKRMTYLFWAYSYGLTEDRLRLYFQDFSRIPVNVPAIPAQSKIVRMLVVWDRTIEVTEKLLENTRKHKSALLRTLVTGEQRLHGFNKSWKPIKISNMGKVVGGGTPDTAINKCWNGPILWATPTDITKVSGRFITTTERKITDFGLKNSAAKKLPPGTLLVCTRATICELAIAKFEITTNQGFKSVIPNSKFSSEFLYYLFLANKRIFVRRACGSTFLELSKRDFENITFNIPELAEQQAIVDFMNSIDDQIVYFYEKLKNLRQQKISLMQQLLTGKRRVQVDNPARAAA